VDVCRLLSKFTIIIVMFSAIFYRTGQDLVAVAVVLVVVEDAVRFPA